MLWPVALQTPNFISAHINEILHSIHHIYLKHIGLKKRTTIDTIFDVYIHIPSFYKGEDNYPLRLLVGGQGFSCYILNNLCEKMHENVTSSKVIEL